MTNGTVPQRAMAPQLRPEAFLTVQDLVVSFRAGRGRRIQAVSGVTFDVVPGETLGLIGETGCGKSTTGRAIAAMQPTRSGRIVFDGTEITELSRRELRELRPRMQMIFQDPISSLNPRRRVADIIVEPLAIWGSRLGAGDRPAQAARTAEMMEAVGLDPKIHARRRPHEFSGGQCQRISIARALMLQPDMLICDEPVSSLDVSVQAQILNLLEDMKARHGLTMIFISHDLTVVHNIADRVAVMYLGKLAEITDPDTLYQTPAHHYTAALLASMPDAANVASHSLAPMIAGEPPSPIDPPSGCRFRTRCPAATELCATTEPPMRPIGPNHYVACHHPVGQAKLAPRLERATGLSLDAGASQEVQEPDPGVQEV